MMQPADPRNGDHLTLGGWLYLSPEGRIPIQREVRAEVVVIGNVVLEDAPKMEFSENDQVIGALASNRADDSLSVRVLPGGSRSGDDLSDAHSSNSGTKVGAVDGIAVAEEIAGDRITTRKSFDHLLRRPLGRRMTGHVEVHNAPAVVGEDDEAEQESKSGRGNDEEVTSGGVTEMIL